MTTPKTALVTGASRGIGHAIARCLASDGFRVGVHDHSNHKAAGDTLAALPGMGHVLLPADLADPANVEPPAAHALDLLDGRVDGFVHNAGIYFSSPILETASLEEWRRALQMQNGRRCFGRAGRGCPCRHSPGPSGVSRRYCPSGRLFSHRSGGLSAGQHD